MLQGTGKKEQDLGEGTVAGSQLPMEQRSPPPLTPTITLLHKHRKISFACITEELWDYSFLGLQGVTASLLTNSLGPRLLLPELF